MKGVTVICLFALCAAAFARPDEKYTDRYDNVNVKEITENPKLYDTFFKCVMEITKKCPPDANELKSHVADALETGCSKCTDVQKTRTEEVISFLINSKPDHWKQLCDKYDPTKKYQKQYEDQLKKVQKSH